MAKLCVCVFEKGVYLELEMSAIEIRWKSAHREIVRWLCVESFVEFRRPMMGLNKHCTQFYDNAACGRIE